MANRFCTSCGASLDDGKKFCTVCGAAADVLPAGETVMAGGAAAPPPAAEPARQAQAAPSMQGYQPQQPLYQQTQPVYPQPAPPPGDVPPSADSKYAPIGTGGWIGIMLLLMIPVFNLILLIVWACGGCKKVTKRGFARAMLILMVIGLILSVVIGLAARSFIGQAVGGIKRESGISDTVGLGKMFGGGSNEIGGESGDSLTSLLGVLGGLEALGGETKGSDNGLSALAGLLEEAEKAAGSSENSGLSAASGAASGAFAGNGWPAGLRPYPSGNVTHPMEYRAEIRDTSREEMVSYIETLKKDGFAFQDFLDFGFTEQEMLDDMNGWWATDGSLYIGVSYYEGIVTVDYMDEKPTMERLMSMMG